MRMNAKVLGGAFVAAMAAAAPGQAATILINELLTNPSFEAGTGATCPTGWTCVGANPNGFGTYSPTAAQYTDSPAAPDGSNVAYAPLGLSGTGQLYQTLSSLNYVVGDEYVFKFWIGMPLTEPDGTTAVNSYPQSVSVSWLIGGVASNLCDGWGTAKLTPVGGSSASDSSGPCTLTITSPGAGQWQEYELIYTPKIQRTGSVGIHFGVQASGSIGQPKAVNIDISLPRTEPDPTPVPEPASLALLGMGLAGLGLWRSRRRSRLPG